MAETLNRFSDTPVFSGFLIDASGSMERYQRDVIEGHKLMLSSLRGSEKCAKGVLYVAQSLFADTPTRLHGFYPLDRNGKDQVTILDDRNYKPGGMTALYDSVYQMLKEMETQVEFSLKQGYIPTARIAVITDGGENNSQKANDSEIKAAIQTLRSRELLQQSLVVGLKNQDFDEGKLEDLRQALGFSQAISLTRDEKQIRRAFVLASKFVRDKS